jgi:probable F420-dependent oxidoreductase
LITVGADCRDMHIGVVFPQLDIGDDPAVVAEYARTVEDLGYDHVLSYDHVVGVDPDRAEPEGPYDLYDQFHEPLTLYGFMAGITESIDLVTGILILPQRQTTLVAKQAAEVDVLSRGRLRVGVGVGWNEPEYVALGEEFSNRGRRVDEQIEVLREYWTGETVEFDGEYHEIPGVGLNPRPVQRPIPIWVGGTADPALRRAARLGDGYLPQFQPGPDAEETLDRLYEYADDAGRDPDDLGIHGRLPVAPDDPDGWIEDVQAWADLGADYLALDTMGQDLRGSEHADLLRVVAETLDEADLLGS